MFNREGMSGCIEEIRAASVEHHAMSDGTFPLVFIGGSRDGDSIEATTAPEHCEVTVCGDVVEIYERQNDEPPFVYVQIGYAGNETWK